ncbi:uncharacterized protein EV420DRAFT_933083 [Desarmillaria tabescens]|uniref:Homeobox domain-containing protein n=1 Tax=Armillaria tabescens TaxID=1929756 RepID=A0AA39TSG8_ARMTA|nr:uncharacterized protein EV420DRAFT_933083 [Desarmillaria tabescens]KAK0464998.1 hypothetical protein EV420DRAFT_933083 [Desarmillaria tabescens]
MPAQGLDMLLLAARYIEEFDNSSSDAPYRSENPISCAEKAENAIHVVTPCEGSPGYTSMSLSEPTSQLTEIANKHLPSECPSSASSPPSSPCPSSVDSDYTMSFQSSKSVSSRECSPEIRPRNVSKFPKKAAHKSPKTALVGGKVFNIPIMTRDMMWRMSVLRTANSIETTPNSPVKETSRQLLEKVYDDVTSHPPKFWEQLIAARVLDRTPAQVRVWFSNRRQWYPSGTTIQVPLLDRDLAYPRRRTVKLRPSALEMSQEWSDSFFDDVLALYMGEQVQDTLKEECEHKRKSIPRYKGKSKKGQVKSK